MGKKPRAGMFWTNPVPAIQAMGMLGSAALPRFWPCRCSPVTCCLQPVVLKGQQHPPR